MKPYFFKLTSQYGSDLTLKYLDWQLHRFGGTAIGKRKASYIIEYFAIFKSKFALAQTNDHFIGSAGFGKNNDVFILGEGRHSGDVKFKIADLSADRRQFEGPRRPALYGFVDFEGITGKNQRPIGTPIRS